MCTGEVTHNERNVRQMGILNLCHNQEVQDKLKSGWMLFKKPAVQKQKKSIKIKQQHDQKRQCV
jgi:hypothetical protein